MCENNECKQWRSQLKYQQYQLAGWTITTTERALHSDRLKINASFENEDAVIYPPDSITTVVDDCNGQQYFEFLQWIANHPIKTGLEYPLNEITQWIGPRQTKKHYDILEDTFLKKFP